ncbi:SNF2 family N-terminal domain-containing protein [Blyttiomyces helicus]|uniref:SNF2 family N-terminal domain-containing protein n=1 Tax=Blyttiomyces helicus TaxID=388810 RepID=A0A4P9WHN2_9FUNG|nr:SNF2 family N-terminal domain-containing protein [Blyttiomyces helicus]|eukprot:RKO92339.1 SNF2 family N-terminal domain-containing protein [Blyttiomyces helicus]
MQPGQSNALPGQSPTLPPLGSGVQTPTQEQIKSIIAPPPSGWAPAGGAITAAQHQHQPVGGSPLTQSAHPTTDPAPSSTMTVSNMNGSAAAPQLAAPPPNPFTPSQLSALRFQIYVFKLISQNKPIPESLQQNVLDPNFLKSGPPAMQAHQQQQLLAQQSYGQHSLPQQPYSSASQPGQGVGQGQIQSVIPGRLIEAVYKAKSAQAQAQGGASQGPVPGQDAHAPLAPSQPPAPTLPAPSPFALLPQKIMASDLCHRLIIPGANPIGIDPITLHQERERTVRARIQYRIQELESLPSNLSNDAGQKIKALIELKSLRLLDKQRRLRSEIVGSLSRATTLSTAVDRNAFRRVKKQSLREVRSTERQERTQRVEREKRDRAKHGEYLNSILHHGAQLLSFHRQQQTKATTRLATAVQRFHANAEKEEVKRLQRVSQERLNALRSNDEEAYLKLIDKTKDTRITTLLSQTDAYLKSLTSALQVQKASVVDETVPTQTTPTDSEAGPLSPEARDDEDYYTAAHRVTEIVTTQPSILVGGTLKDYQIKGLQWMVSLYNNRLNGILADEMGLGKTIQTLSLITYLIEKKKQNGPFLVLVPMSTLSNWVNEFEKWAPSVTKIVYKGIPAARKLLANQVRSGNFNALITTFEMIIQDKAILSKVNWVHLIIDEGHRMKNKNSKLSNTIYQYYKTRYRLILTGTPLQNNLPELWSLLNFVLPKIFDSVSSFEEWFARPFASTGQEKVDLNEEESLLIIRRLHKVLRPFLLRRLKKDVESQLPDKIENVIYCPMTTLQKLMNDRLKTKKTAGFGQGKNKAAALNNLMMQLRKMNPLSITDRNLYRVSGKMELLDRILPKYFATKHRVLMFFQMTAVMNIFEDYLNLRGWRYLRLDGQTKSEDRTDMLHQFNGKNAAGEPLGFDDLPFIFLLSTRAGGLGLNLQTADTVIIFDSDWNPHQDLQAQDRAHRIGQTKEVRILRLITEKSVEEHILQRAREKLDMDGKVIQAGKFDQKTSDGERDALLRAYFEEDAANATDDVDGSKCLGDTELNEIIARSEEELELFQRMDEERALEEQLEWTNRGGRGPCPPRLIELSEIPESLRNLPEPDEVEAEEELGRGARSRREVHYDDGLNEDQWLEAMEEGDVDAVIAKKRERRAKREERKRAREVEDQDEGENEPGPDGAVSAREDEDEEIESARRRRTSKKRSAPDDDDDDEERAAPGSGLVEPEEPTPVPKSGKKRGRRPKGRLDDEPSTPIAAPPKKRRKLFGVDKDEIDPLPPALRERMKAAFNECYKAVNASMVEVPGYHPRQRSALFQELPSRSDFPDYYQLIATPIALDAIKHRMQHAYYKTVDAFAADFRLMFANAMQYNLEGSEIWHDAQEMRRVFDRRLAEVWSEGDGDQDVDMGAGDDDYE